MAQHYLPQVSLFTACVLFALLVSIPHGQPSCSLCQYKSVSTTTDITVFISNSTCSVLNATVTGTQSSITVTGLQPGYIYFLKINCTDMCCDNFTTNTYSNLTITQLNTTSVYLNWMGQNVLANQTVIMRPEPVSNLTVISTTVSSVTLSWVTSNGISPYYRVVWGTNTSFQLLTTNQTSMHISQLQPGTKYIFNVTSLAPDNVTEGRSVQISQNTNPAQVENIDVLNSNSSVNVSWAAPPGRVESYMVNISSAELNTLQSLSTSANKTEFSNLTAGRIYNLTITSISGILKNVSVIKQFATKPNPPEALSVRGQTNESISLLWSKPLLMDGVIVSYEVSYRQSQSGVNQTLDQLTSLNVTLPNLSSGSQYNITVVTVGVSNLRSSYVNLTAYTAPNAVKSLAVSAVSTDSVNLTWDPPDGTPSLFSYSITAPNQTFNTSPTNYMINQLQPGTQYNCSVKTCINESICGPLQTIQCNTKPMPVISLIASRLGSTGMRLSWSSQSDYKSTYLYSVSVNEGQWNLSSNKTVDVFGLIPGTNYTFTVQTVANSISSEPVTISAYTGLDKASIISVVGTTTSLTVEWTPPSGNVTLYSIKIQQNRTVLKTENRTNVTPVVFSDLIPGSAYTVTVTSISGPIMTESDPVMNATFPTPPGELNVTARSMNSLSIGWARPINMSSVRHSFILQYSNNTLISASVNCSQNSSTLSGLSAGVQYNITVKTVGEMGYLSSPQQLTTYTNPSAVSDVMVNGSYEKIVSLSWQQLDLQQNGYMYLLAFTSNNTGMQITVNKSSAQLSLMSASTYNISIITQTAGNTKSDPRFITAYTKPFPVSSLRFEVFNVSTVKLSWSRPQEYHSGISYQILVSNCTKNTVNLSTTYENITVWDLQPGTLCQFSVSSSANGILGDPVNNSTLTKPSMANPRFPDQVSNDSLLVMWDHPNGELDRYILNISSEGGIKSVTLSNIQHNHTFTQLKAATVYTVMLTTVRGNFQATSSSISRATYPNRPGEIVELFKYTSSVLLRWAEAQNMTAGSFNYSLTYQQPGYNTSTLVTANNTFLLDNLRSGTSYNVSVATVGLMGFQSESVFRYPVTTKPDAVRDLTVVSTTVNAISIAWSGVDGVPKYVVSVHSEDGKLVKNTNTTTLSVDNLTASTRYNISVQSSTSDNTEGSAVWLSDCTDAAPLEHLVCKGPNLTEPMLSLTWSQPPGRYRAFEIKLSSSSSSEETTQLNHNFTALKYNTQYTVYIWTLGCGAKSTRKEISCMTGITKPVVPQIQTAVEVTETQYNKFTVILKPEVFNDLNGPVLFYGVLVSTGNIDCTNQCVSNTYEDWKAGKCSAYLAVIKETEVRKAADQTVVIGDQTVWKGYKNGELDAKGSYKFAVITFTRMELNKNGLVDESSYYSISQFCESSVILPENPVVIGAAAAGAAFAALLIVIIIGALVFKRKQRKDDSTSVPIHSIRNKVSDPIKVEDYEAYYRRQRADSFCGFAQEFEDLRPVGMNQPKTVATALENKAKNRYNNVLPYDPSRVKLSVLGSPFDDYINASYMPGYASKKEFIAAQGPLPCTVNDFWRMIWEKNVHTIVMLTKCNEQGRVKCEEYWPAEMKHFNNLTVTTISEIPLEDWTIRDFEVKNVKTAEARSVRHFHFTAWPDHGVPETTELLINFRHLVREHMDQYSRHSPTLVHCSAGVGRTGTFIAIDRLIFQIERDGVVDVYGIIHDLRMHRPLMVQTEDQYVFLNQCAMDIIRSRTGNNVDLIYQNTAALTIYENFEPLKKAKNGYHKA